MPESGVSTLLATSIATSPVRRFTVSLINVLFIVALFVAVTPTEVRAATNAGMLSCR